MIRLILLFSKIKFLETHSKIKKQIRTLELNGKNKTEIIAYDETDFTIEKLIKLIKDIIHSKTYSIENFNRIIKLNEDLEHKIRELENENKQSFSLSLPKKTKMTFSREKDSILKGTCFIKLPQKNTNIYELSYAFCILSSAKIFIIPNHYIYKICKK